jgi:dienelactone hydrolase
MLRGVKTLDGLKRSATRLLAACAMRHAPCAVVPALVLALVLGGQMSAALAQARLQPELAPERIVFPARAEGRDWQVTAFVYRPPGKGPFPLLVFSHGRSGKAEERAALRYPVPLGHVAYWQRKGFAVMAPIRPGYGETGGPDIESSGNRIDRAGACQGAGAYHRVARNAADVVEAAVKWGREQKWVNPRAILLAGQSVGGLTSAATGARNLPGVIGYINFSGGTGGDPEKRPKASCFPELLEQVYGTFGRTTRVPNIWLYAPNDLFWGEEAPRRWHRAFAAAGGRGEFVMTAPVPNEDGHRLLLRGGRLWSIPVDRFLSGLGIAAR